MYRRAYRKQQLAHILLVSASTCARYEYQPDNIGYYQYDVLCVSSSTTSLEQYDYRGGTKESHTLHIVGGI